MLGCALLGATLILVAPARAAVGADDFGNASPLLFSVPGTVPDSQTYTKQSGEPATTGCSSPSIEHTAWWHITGTGQPITLTTAASDFDTVLAVYDAPTGLPLVGNRVACNDDDPAPGAGATSALSFPSTRGKRYLVSVGSRGASEYGRIDVKASASRPANDDRVSARALDAGVPVAVSNSGASQELGETLTCGTASYAATIWFKWVAPATGDATISSFALFGDTVTTVYRDGVVVGCATGSTARVLLRAAPGEYLVQVASKGADVDGLGVGTITTRADFTLDPDVDNDGEPASTDCNDTNPAIRHGVVDVPDDGIDQDCDGADTVVLDRDRDGENRPSDCDDGNAGIRHGVVDVPDDGIDQNCDGADAVNLDRDRDGENRPGDCNDADPAINHGAKDIPGNAIDEDCKDGPAPFPRIGSSVKTGWRLNPFRLTKIEINQAVAGSRVEFRCSGRGCPFKRSVVKVRKSANRLPVLPRKLKRARLKRGAVVEVRITSSGHVGFERRHTVRGPAQDPKLEDLCLPVGAKAPSRC
jgi:hypothetical protein